MNRWQNQEEAYQLAMARPAVMLDMDMGTGKTRVAIDVAMTRPDVHNVLVVCPKAIIPVWRENLNKFYVQTEWDVWDKQSGTIVQKLEDLKKWMDTVTTPKKFVIINYDIVWRANLGDYIHKNANFDMVILDESHRAKTAGSKVSKFLAMVGKHTKYRMCLSGSPMSNSPLDVYGQYRFLDPSIFGTNHFEFLQKYAIFGGPERKFVVGFKNQQELKEKFASIAYSCKMSDIADRLKLPDVLPPVLRKVSLPPKDLKLSRDFAKDFIAEVKNGVVVANNVLTKMLRLQQITSGFTRVTDVLTEQECLQELNTVKFDALISILEDLSITENVVVFCVFKHDLLQVKSAAQRVGRGYFEVSGAENTLQDWKHTEGAVLAVQIQAGAEGIDLTKSNFAIYYALPYSLALYSQSKARLFRPGQVRPVTFLHLIAENTIDESIYNLLMRKEDVILAIKNGTFDFGFMH